MGTIQQDAGRNIEGDFVADNSQTDNPDGRPPGGSVHGCFYVKSQLPGFDLIGGYGTGYMGGYIGIDASRSWGAGHAADEFRPLNMAVLFCIKHD